MYRALRGVVRKFRSINQRYRAPRIGMTPAVRVSLMVLRVYLLALVLLMVYKFATLLSA